MAYVIQLTYILLAPTLMAASIYMMLGRIIHLTDGEARSIISSSKITKIFVTGDVICLLAQSGGKQARLDRIKQSSLARRSAGTDNQISRRRPFRRRPLNRNQNRNRRPSPANPRIPRLRHDSSILQRPHQQGPDSQINRYHNRLAPTHASDLRQLGTDLPSLGSETCRVRGRILGVYLHARMVFVLA